MRLIDADELFNWGDKKLKNAVKYGNENAEQQSWSYSTLMMYEIADEIDEAPTIDAVPVVRCKDCHYISEYDEYIRDKDEIAHGLWCRLKNHSCEPDDYCSCGYREATT